MYEVDVVVTFKTRIELDPNNYANLGNNPSLKDMIATEKELLLDSPFYLIEDLSPDTVSITPVPREKS